MTIESSGESQTLFLSDGCDRSGNWDGVRGRRCGCLCTRALNDRLWRQQSLVELGAIRLEKRTEAIRTNQYQHETHRRRRRSIVTHAACCLGARCSFDGALNLRTRRDRGTVSVSTIRSLGFSFDDSQQRKSTDLVPIHLGRLKFRRGQLTGVWSIPKFQTVARCVAFRAYAVPIHVQPHGTRIHRAMVLPGNTPRDPAKRGSTVSKRAASKRVVQRRQKQGGVFNALARALRKQQAGTETSPASNGAMHLRFRTKSSMRR